VVGRGEGGARPDRLRTGCHGRSHLLVAVGGAVVGVGSMCVVRWGHRLAAAPAGSRLVSLASVRGLPRTWRSPRGACGDYIVYWAIWCASRPSRSCQQGRFSSSTVSDSRRVAGAAA